MAGGINNVENDKAVIPVTPDPSRVRTEIDELLADNEMTNLYLLALEVIQTEDPKKAESKEDWWTFYSIAGETSVSMAISFQVLTRLPRYS